MQMIFELGFSYVILQMASHERARLSISPDYEIIGDPIAHARLASVIQKSVRWYSVAAVLLAATLVPVGFYFFSTHQHAGRPFFGVFPGVLPRSWRHSTSRLIRFCLFWKAVDTFRKLPVFALCSPSREVCWRGVLWQAHHGLFAPSMMLLGMASSALVWLVVSINCCSDY